jgi:hypothetical protein
MQNNSITSQTDIANVTVVTEENQIIVPQPITSVIEVNNPGPQGPVGPQGVAGPSEPFANIGGGVYATTSSIQVSGSFLVSGSSTFTNIGPAIFSGSANIVGATTMSSALVTGNVTVLGTASIGTLVVNQTVLSTGSNQLGDSANDTQTLYGSVIIPTGSLTVSGSARINGSIGVNRDAFGGRALDVLGGGIRLVGSTNGSFEVNGGNATTTISTIGGLDGLTLTDTSNAILKFSAASYTYSFFLGGGNQRFEIRDQNQSGATRFAITNTGNVLIGTTTDSGYRLDVVSGSIRSISTSSFAYNRIETTVSAGSLGVGVEFKNGLNTTTIGANTTRTYIYSGQGSTENFTILHSNGNVGIGTTAPDYPLHITRNSTNNYIQLSGNTSKGIFAEGSGLIAFDTAGNLSIYTGGVNLRATFTSSGSLGIGTSTPSSSLHIGPNTGTLSTGLTFGTGTSGIWLLDNTVMGIKVANADRLWIRTTDFYPDSSMTLGLTNRRWTALYTAQITDNGTNVGVGITTPSASLHIKGATTSSLSSSLLVQDSGSIYSFRIKDNGDVAFNSNYITINGYDTTINSGNGVAVNGAAFIPGYIYRSGTTSGFLTLANDSTVASGITLFGSTHATLPNIIRVTAPSGIQITGSLNISGSTPSLQLGTSNSVGDFTNPTITFGSTSNGIYLDSSRIFFKAGGVFSGAFTSDGYVTNQIQIKGALINDLTTAMFIPYRLNAIGLSSGLGGDSTGAVTLITSGSTRLYVSSSGNVGIGTSTPTKRLEIHDSTSGDGLAIARGAVPAQRIELIPNDSTVSTLIKGGGNGKPFYIASWANGGTAQPLYFGTNYSNGIDQVRMTIDATGSVGIGITTPAALLHISGASSLTLLRVDSPTVSGSLFVSGSGNVGIGTTTPPYTLTVKQPSNSTSTGFQITQADGASSGMVLQYISNVAIIKNRSTGDLTLGTNDSERLRILSAGNVGINTTSPSAQLQVKGSGATSATTAFLVQNSTPTTLFQIQDHGSSSFAGNMTVTGSVTGFIPLTSSGSLASFNGYQAPYAHEAFIEVGMRQLDGGIPVGISILGGSNIAGTRGGFLESRRDRRAISFNDLGIVSIATTQISSSQYSALSIGAAATSIGSLTPNRVGIQLAVLPRSILMTGNAALQQEVSFNSFETSSLRTNIFATTYTNAYNVYIEGQPTAGSNVTFTNAYSLYVNSGKTYLGGNTLIGTSTDSGFKLDVSGSGRFTNNITVTGSVTVSNILTLTPQTPLPSGVATGSFAVSSSVPPKPYFYDGTTWNALY